MSLAGNRSPISALPPEILLCIFKYAYVAARRQIPFKFQCYKETCKAEKKCFCDVEPDHEYGWDQVVQSPFRQFPNSVASVCSRWEEIMLRVPIFWTRIVIQLDDDNFSPRKLGLKLHASRDQPIEVIVTRISFLDSKRVKDIERSRMIEIITALRSHVNRCQTLQFDVVYSSSLPRLLAILPPKMPHIQELVLESCIDSGCPEVQPYSQANADHVHSIDWGSLNTITIDGWNFAELYSRTPTPNQQIFLKCVSLTIKFGGDGFSSSNITRLLGGSLEYLEVDSVAFAPGDGPQPYSLVDSFTLRNLNAEVTDIMLGVCRLVGELTFDNCSSMLITRLPIASTLHLANISSGYDFTEFVQMWNGMTLNVTACSGFDDDALHLMTRMSANVRNSRLSALQDLTITDCHNFTIDALKELVETRTNNNGTLEWLMIQKCGSALSDDDFIWFEERVSAFLWRTYISEP